MKRGMPREFSPLRSRRGAKLFVCLSAVLCVLVLTLLHRGVRHHPSAEVEALIAVNAQEYGVSASLLEAVILAESKFDESAVSHMGAVGMMQLMPETAEWIGKESGLPFENLESPTENMSLGSWYLRFLLDKYEGNEVLALAAYNAGRGNVDDWMLENDWSADMSSIQDIPFPETREFVKAVLAEQERLNREKEEIKHDR